MCKPASVKFALPLRANADETLTRRKFTLEGAGEIPRWLCRASQTTRSLQPLALKPRKAAGRRWFRRQRLGDPSWDLGPAVFRENARRCHVTVYFDVLEHADVQAAMRAYLYARLNVDLPGHRAKLTPASIRQAFNRARRFFAFAREKLGFLDLGLIDQPLVDAYARHLRSVPARRAVIVSQLLEVVFDLRHYRQYLPCGGLGFEPWDGRTPARVAGYRHIRENACITARHRPAWERSVQEARMLLKERRPSDLQHAALTAELERLTTVVEAIDPAWPDSTPG